MLKNSCEACHSERSEESRSDGLFRDPPRGRARFLASLGMTHHQHPDHRQRRREITGPATEENRHDTVSYFPQTQF